MRKKLELYLQNNEIGKVISIVLIPDYSKTIDLEIEKSELVDFKKILNRNDIEKNHCCFPKLYSSEESLKDHIEKLENKIKSFEEHQECMSGQAFVCFDSLLTAETILFNCQ